MRGIEKRAAEPQSRAQVDVTDDYYSEMLEVLKKAAAFYSHKP